MGWDRIGKGREGKEREGKGRRGWVIVEIVTYQILFLSFSLSLSWVSAGSYLPYQAVYVCTYLMYIYSTFPTSRFSFSLSTFRSPATCP